MQNINKLNTDFYIIPNLLRKSATSFQNDDLILFNMLLCFLTSLCCCIVAGCGVLSDSVQCGVRHRASCFLEIGQPHSVLVCAGLPM